MKYAREVITLLAAYPERAFRMQHILRSLAQGATLGEREKQRVRKGVLRILHALAQNGLVRIELGVRPQEGFVYVWRRKPVQAKVRTKRGHRAAVQSSLPGQLDLF